MNKKMAWRIKGKHAFLSTLEQKDAEGFWIFPAKNSTHKSPILNKWGVTLGLGGSHYCSAFRLSPELLVDTVLPS